MKYKMWKTLTWGLWDIFQSKTVKEIYDHMTMTEKEEEIRWRLNLGVLLGCTVCIPIVLMTYFIVDVFLITNIYVIMIMLIIDCILIYSIMIVIAIKKRKEFLSSLSWAKINGYTAENIKLFELGRADKS